MKEQYIVVFVKQYMYRIVPFKRPGGIAFCERRAFIRDRFLTHCLCCFKRSMHTDRHTGTLPYAQCNTSSGSPRKKEYITMDARIVVANMHV